MLPEWHNVQRVLIIHTGTQVLQIIPALRILRQSLPDAQITLMTTLESSRMVQLPWVDNFLVYEGDFTSLNPKRELALVESLSHKAFDAAIIFTHGRESPYPLAYICYLAGIPIRLGQSQEFGGSVLSHWIKPEKLTTQPIDQHLFLLESAGFSKA